MVSLRINGASVSPDDESTVVQQVNGRRDEGVRVCVQLTVAEGDLNVALSSSQCGGSGGGGRPPRPSEKRVFELWDKLGLNDESFTGGQLVAFLKQLSKLLP